MKNICHGGRHQESPDPAGSLARIPAE